MTWNVLTEYMAETLWWYVKMEQKQYEYPIKTSQLISELYDWFIVYCATEINLKRRFFV